MTKQSFSNHVRYYIPHHFIFYPVVCILLFFSLYKVVNDEGNRDTWLIISALVIILGWLSFMMRQHYALTCQNRIVRLEMRLRYYQLSGKRLEDIEPRISFDQLAALRFASDEELIILIEKTLQENLTPRDIKTAIRYWNADNMRV